MASRKFVFIISLLFCCFCQAQQLVLTQTGLKSSENSALPYVEYPYKDCTRQQIKNHLEKRFENVLFFKYSIKQIDDHTITIDGFMEGSCFLVFGNREIAFCMKLELGETSIKVGTELTKINGKPLNYGLVFSKNGKVRFAPAKNKIEEDVARLIKDIFENQIIIV